MNRGSSSEPARKPTPQEAQAGQFKGWRAILAGSTLGLLGVVVPFPHGIEALCQVGLGMSGGVLLAQGWVLLSSSYEDLTGREAWWDFFRYLW